MSNDKLAQAEGLQPIETIRYWLNAYSDPASGDHFMGHGMVVALLREYLQLREAEKQAGPVAEPIGYLNPKVLGPDGKIAATDALTHSGVPVGGWTLPIYAAPPSESDKEDAESDMASPEYQAGWNAAMDAMTRAMTRVETLDAIRAKKEPQ